MGTLRAASSNVKEEKSRLCSGGYTQKLALLQVELDAWLSARVRYWNLYRQDVRRALDATRDVLAHQSDAGSRLNREVEEARKELDSLKRQREETRKSPATVSGADEPDTLIALAEDRTRIVTNASGVLEDTSAKQQEALIGKIGEALRLAEFDRQYWLSVYSRRSAQTTEICAPPSAPPGVVK